MNTYTFTCFSPNAPVSYTSKRDIGKVMVQLTILSMSSNYEVASSVPDYVRVCGSTKSFAEVAEIFNRVRKSKQDWNGKEIVVQTQDVNQYREKLAKSWKEGIKEPTPLAHIK